MSSKEDGIIIILSSPSGAGKTTLSKLLSKNKKFNISISYTTRKPRDNEINGKDYHFIKKENFKNLIKNNELLEHAKVFNHYYGTSRSFVIENLKKGKNVIFDIDWQGTEQIKEKKLKYKIITIFILPPSRKELLNRLLNRDINDEKNAMERMKQFDEDVRHWKNYDLVVINDDFIKCYEKIIKYINSKKNNISVSYDKNEIDKHILNLLK